MKTAYWLAGQEECEEDVELSGLSNARQFWTSRQNNKTNLSHPVLAISLDRTNSIAWRWKRYNPRGNISVSWRFKRRDLPRSKSMEHKKRHRQALWAVGLQMIVFIKIKLRVLTLAEPPFHGIGSMSAARFLVPQRRLSFPPLSRPWHLPCSRRTNPAGMRC